MLTTTITRDSLRTAIPTLDGTVRLAGLDGPVDVVRDSLGIPHCPGHHHPRRSSSARASCTPRIDSGIWSTTAGAPWAAGPSTSGQTASIRTGLMRKAGLAASAQADYDILNDETRAMLDAYAAGVNAFIAHHHRPAH